MYARRRQSNDLEKRISLCSIPETSTIIIIATPPLKFLTAHIAKYFPRFRDRVILSVKNRRYSSRIITIIAVRNLLPLVL